eukprot:scaffold7832_cov106-Isochrysis_galbana.AAC.11
MGSQWPPLAVPGSLLLFLDTHLGTWGSRLFFQCLSSGDLCESAGKDSVPNSFGQPGRHAARPGPGHSGAVGASTDTHIPPLCRAAHDLLERPRRSERGVGRAARQRAGWGCEGGGATGGSRRFTRHRTDASHVGRRGRAPRRDARHAGAQREGVRHRGAVHARRRHRAAAPRRERVERRQPVPRKTVSLSLHSQAPRPLQAQPTPARL